MYKVITTKSADKNGFKQKRFGISYNGQDYPNLSQNRRETRKLVRLCNKLRLDPVHIEDVIEDFVKFGVPK